MPRIFNLIIFPSPLRRNVKSISSTRLLNMILPPSRCVAVSLHGIGCNESEAMDDSRVEIGSDKLLRTLPKACLHKLKTKHETKEFGKAQPY